MPTYACSINVPMLAYRKPCEFIILEWRGYQIFNCSWGCKWVFNVLVMNKAVMGPILGLREIWIWIQIHAYRIRNIWTRSISGSSLYSSPRIWINYYIHILKMYVGNKGLYSLCHIGVGVFLGTLFLH